MKVPKIVYVAHPIRGDVTGNIKKILAICKRIHSHAVIPFVPYIPVIAYLGVEEGSRGEKLGLWTNHELIKMRIPMEMWLYGDHISEGMGDEIKLARKCHIPVIAKTKGTRDELERWV